MSHTITVDDADTLISGGAGTQYVFQSWSDGGEREHSITVSSIDTITANFATQFYLTTSVTGGDSITPAPPGAWYDSASVVTVTAWSIGRIFAGFSGDLSGTASSQQLIMDSPKSVSASFTDPITAPTLTSPYNGSKVSSTSQTVSWSSVSSAGQYFLQVAEDSTFSGTLLYNQSTGTETSRILDNLTSGTTYYWRVSTDTTQAVSWSKVWHFTVSITAPAASFTVTPQVGTIDTTFSFDASASTDAEDSASVLQVRWDWENDGTWDTSFSTDKTATHQYADTGYYTAALEVMDSGGLKDTATVQIRVAPKVIPAPALVSPANLTVVSSTAQAFTWNFVSEAVSYRFQLSAGDSTFGSSNLVSDTVLSATTVPVSGLSTGTKYYWRVGANSGTAVSWSPVWSYSTAPSIVFMTKPSGLKITANGTEYTAPYTVTNWLPGSSHTIGITDPQHIGTDTNSQYMFRLWNDGGDQQHTITVPENDTIYTAEFKTQFYVATSADSGGTISPTPPGAYFDSSTTAYITATAVLSVYCRQRQRHHYPCSAGRLV